MKSAFFNRHIIKMNEGTESLLHQATSELQSSSSTFDPNGARLRQKKGACQVKST
jgi:hypothetical protein